MRTFTFKKHRKTVAFLVGILWLSILVLSVYLFVITLFNDVTFFSLIYLGLSLLIFLTFSIFYTHIQFLFARQISIGFNESSFTLNLLKSKHIIEYQKLLKFSYDSSDTEYHKIKIQTKGNIPIELKITDSIKFIEGTSKDLEKIADYLQKNILHQKNSLLSAEVLKTISKSSPPLRKLDNYLLYILPNSFLILASIVFCSAQYTKHGFSFATLCSLILTISLIYATIKLKDKFDWLSAIISILFSISSAYLLLFHLESTHSYRYKLIGYVFVAIIIQAQSLIKIYKQKPTV